MYADFSTDYHYDVENKPAFQPPRSLLSLYLDARDLYLLMRPSSFQRSLDNSYPPPSFFPTMSTSELVSVMIEAAWISLRRDTDLPEFAGEVKDNFKGFLQASQLVILLD